MSYLKFDKLVLTNLEKSLDKEMLSTNNAGAYSSTTIVDCNTRKYHGLLVVPIPEFGNDNHLLLSSCDETIIQHGAEFNIGLHRYSNDFYSPKGHKYIREFHYDNVATTIYRIGGVILQKQRLLVKNENRVLISYELLEAHSATTLRLKPFLAFRNVNYLTHKNDRANVESRDVENGVSFCLYDGYPNLVMQTNKKVEWHSHVDWYLGIEYSKEKERGYEFKEDLLTTGYFELPIKKGEKIIFSAGIDAVSPRKLKQLFSSESKKIIEKEDFISSLKNASQQFYYKYADDNFILAGFPWFKCRARDQFISLPGLTLELDNIAMFEAVMKTSTSIIKEYMQGKKYHHILYEIDSPDVLLWFVWAVQQYSIKVGGKEAAKRYLDIVVDIVNHIQKQNHNNLFVHNDGLLYTNGLNSPVTWMNAMENGSPITPRSGYVVEINALWYNALRFVAEMLMEKSQTTQSELYSYKAEQFRESFIAKFWNGTYLYDYIDGDYRDSEVRPNMLFAISLPYSPLNRQEQKSVLDIITKELLTVKGLRSLSPKSVNYRPVYIGGDIERDRNYHNGPIWPWTMSAYVESYIKVYGRSGVSFLVRVMAGLESELSQLTIGTLSELYDGNPPFRGHGAMTYAMTVAEVLRAASLLKEYIEQK